MTSHDPLLPKSRRDDDIFFVSYPRSGITWICFLLANIMVEKLGLDIEVNFFNIHGFVPDIHQGQDIPLDIGFFPFKRMIKSHAHFHSGYKNIIYILRDPRNVMVSYYEFKLGLGEFKGNISSFIKDNKFGITAWSDHVQSWINGVIPGTRFRILKYEDFHSSPEKTVMSIANLIGALLTNDELKRVIKNSSFKNMQKSEEETDSLSIKKYNPNFKFVRKGQATVSEIELSIADISYIKNVAGKLMKKFNYK